VPPEANIAPANALRPLMIRPVHLGVRAPRVEDDRLLRGDATFVADLRLPGMVEAVLVRSQVPHARFRVSLEAARGAKEVVAAFTAENLVDASPLPEFVEWARPVGRFMLARDTARYVGAPLAVVVAADRYAAEDAAELVEVEYDSLPTVASIDEALAPDAPRLYLDWPDNRQVVVTGDDPETDGLFRSAWKVVGGRYVIRRQGAVPMETRGAVAEFSDGRLTLWTSTQVPHWVRTLIPTVLPLPESLIRVVAPDVGGGFGCKWHIYSEEFLLSWLAWKLARPVRWVEDRNEHLLATVQARDCVWDLEAAIAEDGRILALRGQVLQDVGSAETFPVGFGPSFTGAGSLTGPYRITHQKVDVVAAVTNKTPSGAYRGYGNPEAQFALERLIDRCAMAAGVDPFDLRRRMLLRGDELPHTAPTGMVLDSGSYEEAFELVLERTRAALDRGRAERQDKPAVRVGMGVSNFVEGTAATGMGDTGLWGTQESVALRFDPDGGLTVSSGVTTTGQGVTTMLATMAADTVGVPIKCIRVVMGDTDTTPYGLGGWASRSTISAAGAMLKAAEGIRDKALRIAGHLLEVAPEDVVIEDGVLHVAGSPDRFISWRDVARTALVRVSDLPSDIEPGLEATAMYVPPGVDHQPRDDGRMNACTTYANGAVGAIVEVDLETGAVAVLDYLVAHDCGTLLNPVVVDGQIVGGVAQGIGGALLEELAYGSEAQPQATTFMDYLLPTAHEIPPVSMWHIESPSPHTALGVKGAGEAGVIGAYASVAAAVADALKEFGTDEISEMPITPPAGRRLLGQ
jgi:aerobic carbon-monoxide dehydrogenase large subunit